MLSLDYLRELMRKEVQFKSVVKVIMGEAQQLSKNPSHEMIVKIISKLIKNNQSTIALLYTDNKQERAQEFIDENKFLQSLLPPKLTDDDLLALIQSQLTIGKNLPDIMAYLRANYAGQYDGKKVVQIINSIS